MGDRNDVTDRVASRFDRDEDDSNSKSEENDKGDKSSKNATKATNVKEAWNAKSIYLPDDLEGRLGKAYKRLDFELDDDLNEFKKTRHFYPLVVSAGLERIEGMEDEEIIEELERIER